MSSSRLKFEFKPHFNKKEEISVSPIKGSNMDEVVESIRENEIEKLDQKIQN